MTPIDVKERIVACATKMETALAGYLGCDDCDLKEIVDAQSYSLLGGGKRIRPYLVLSVCETLGGNSQKAIALASALEMIHTYSLIHDDLPCMDDDDYRRGRLTNHKVFGEATAVLAGDALLTKAFEVVATDATLSPEEKVAAVTLLSVAAGDCGMIGGQIMDMAAERSKAVSLEYLTKMHGKKTGALIRAAVRLGCLAAGRGDDAKLIQAAEGYAEKIGLAFQIVDDLLDVTGDAALLGKNTGADSANNKTTFMSFYTIEEARQYAAQLTEQAIAEIGPYDGSGTLSALASYLLERDH